jgi:peptidoglycan/xylan/chitin deacetylase (PgdA/CDA1 family)
VTSGAVPLEGDVIIDQGSGAQDSGGEPGAAPGTQPSDFGGAQGTRYRWKARNPKQLLRHLHSALRGLSDRERESVLLALAGPAATLPGPPAHPILSADELCRLADGSHVEVGAHAVTHPVLSLLTPEGQRQEIAGGKARLEAILDRPIEAWSYPYGLGADYTRDTVALVKAAGYRCGCAAVPDLVRAGTNPYRLPRVWVDDCDGERFARLLRQWIRVDETMRRSTFLGPDRRKRAPDDPRLS